MSEHFRGFTNTRLGRRGRDGRNAEHSSRRLVQGEGPKDGDHLRKLRGQPKGHSAWGRASTRAELIILPKTEYIKLRRV